MNFSWDDQYISILVNSKGSISARLLKKNNYSGEFEKDDDLPVGLELSIEKHYQTNLPIFS